MSLTMEGEKVSREHLGEQAPECPDCKAPFWNRAPQCGCHFVRAELEPQIADLETQLAAALLLNVNAEDCLLRAKADNEALRHQVSDAIEALNLGDANSALNVLSRDADREAREILVCESCMKVPVGGKCDCIVQEEEMNYGSR